MHDFDPPQTAVLPQTRQARKKTQRKRPVGKWLARGLLALCFLSGLYFSLVPTGRATGRALLILPGLLSATQPAWQAPVDEPITATQTTVPSAAGTVYLNVYAPSASASPVPEAREGIVLIPGVGDQRTDAQLINFSQTLAHAGIVVMEMTTPALIANHIDAGDKEAVVQAFHALQHWPGVSTARIGLLGFSAGGPLMCLAAADPRVRDQIAFVALFGSYFDTTTMLQTIGRRAQTINGSTQPWQPVAYPLQVLATTIAPFLPNNDGQSVENAFLPGSTGSLTPQQIAQLAPGSAAAYHLLAGDQPDQVAANVAALPSKVKTLLAGLSPSDVVSQIHVPIYLLHDRNDQFVPVSESHEFAAALTRLHHPYDFAEFGIFQHVEVRSDLGVSQLLGDGTTLLRLVSEVVQVSS
ncbi:MAG: alpha/beta hydrolase family protein [Ktedonobacteraceae bacterium]